MTDTLSPDDVSKQVISIVAKQAKVDEAKVTAESTLKDLGVASLEAIEMIFDIEAHFDITIPDQGANFDTDTVQSLVNAVVGCLQAKTAGAVPPAGPDAAA